MQRGTHTRNAERGKVTRIRARQAALFLVSTITWSRNCAEKRRGLVTNSHFYALFNGIN